MKAYTSLNSRTTPQSEQIPGRTDQVKNNAGGFFFAVDDWSRLDRFLVLGSEGGTYYAGEHKLTADNAQAVLRCIKEDGIRAVDRIVEISTEGRAPKNDPALFALAMASGLGDTATKKHALAALPQVARIGTHLFNFLTYVQQFRGWGSLLRDAVGKWYTEKGVEQLAYQLIKYRQRNGWTHRDVLRKAHPKSDDHNDLFKWVTQGEMSDGLPVQIKAYNDIKDCEHTRQALSLIVDYNLPREVVPSGLLNSPDVWQALLEKMPMTAMIRNLGKMTSIGLVGPMSESSRKIADSLKNEDAIRKARVHPLSLLVAMKTYGQGKGVKGSLTWSPDRAVMDALDEAFYLSFGNIEPTGKRTLLALDVSWSMAFTEIAGMAGISPRIGSAAMAMVTARVEQEYAVVGFTGGATPLDISPRQRLDDVVRKVSNLPFDRTDCAQPMIFALERRVPVDTFVIYTDNETWSGSIHPSQALDAYRQKTGINAKLVVVGMTATGFSIADPNDSGMLDVVGFDTATPNIISEFSK